VTIRRAPRQPSASGPAVLRALYICYLSLEDPLVHSQVVAYLEGLGRRQHVLHLLTFDGDISAQRRHELEQDLARRGIRWHSLRYHKRPSLPATVYDALAGALAALRIMRRHGLEAIHARNHVPAATALIVRRLTRCRIIFDLRGLMAEEYVDAGHWRRDGLAYRITNWIQQTALRRADGIVMLTEAVRNYLFADRAPAAPVAVIPCCADVHIGDSRDAHARAIRAELGVGDRPVMIYVGKFTGWYMDREMVEFYRSARRLQPHLLFLVLTQADPSAIETELGRQGIPASDYVITRAEPAAVRNYLAAADYGISFVRPSLSKISSSPTKIAEYLAAGVPVVSTAIGDLVELFAEGELGVLIDDFAPAAYEAAATAVEALARDAAARDRRRAVARRRLSLQEVGIPRYDWLYREVARR
jgi:glycosyltransferase involved in cell wall biosynthesis